MLNYNFTWVIAENVFESLGIPEDMSKQFTDDEQVRNFHKQYSEDYIRSLVEAEIAKYDTSGNVESDIDGLIEDSVNEVLNKISAIEEEYYMAQQALMNNAYAEIVDVLQNTVFQNIVDVDSEYESADPSVGIFNEERYINFKLSNGKYITFTVEFED